ncbi:MAG: DUF6553 family protein [Lachnospiraceae bacterium]
MYEQSAKLNMYYREIDPGKRKQLLDELCMTEEDDGANEYRRHLYELRHVDRKDPAHEVDLFLWNCINLPFIYKSKTLFMSGPIKEVRKIMKDMGAAESSEYGDAGEKAFYWEMRNTMKRYLSTCDDKNYRRKLFGLMSASDEDRIVQTCKDAWEMSYGIAGRLHLEDEMKVFCKAVEDEYSTIDDGAAARFAEYSQNHDDSRKSKQK